MYAADPTAASPSPSAGTIPICRQHTCRQHTCTAPWLPAISWRAAGDTPAFHLLLLPPQHQHQPLHNLPTRYMALHLPPPHLLEQCRAGVHAVTCSLQR